MEETMPREKREGEYRTLYAELPADLVIYLKERAVRHNRTQTGELVQILTDLRAGDHASRKEKKK